MLISNDGLAGGADARKVGQKSFLNRQVREKLLLPQSIDKTGNRKIQGRI